MLEKKVILKTQISDKTKNTTDILTQHPVGQRRGLNVLPRQESTLG